MKDFIERTVVGVSLLLIVAGCIGLLYWLFSEQAWWVTNLVIGAGLLAGFVVLKQA